MTLKGGFARAARRVAGAGARCVQIFAGNPTAWQMGQAPAGEIEARGAALLEAGLRAPVIHCSYLINLASVREEVRRRSAGLLDETMRRAALYGAPAVILHPGSHGGAGVEEGRWLVAAALAEGRSRWPGGVKLLLENTAGTGAALGATFKELAQLLEGLPPEGFGICLDTAHAWGAGYDLGDPAAVRGVLEEIDGTLGLERVGVIHLNDSAVARGSRRDRHAHMGAGQIGQAGLSTLLRRGWPPGLPVILETPEAGTGKDDENLAALRSLIGPEACD